MATGYGTVDEGPKMLMNAEQRKATITESLIAEKDRLSKRVAEIDEALEILERQPDMERFLTLLGISRF